MILKKQISQNRSWDRSLVTFFTITKCNKLQKGYPFYMKLLRFIGHALRKGLSYSETVRNLLYSLLTLQMLSGKVVNVKIKELKGPKGLR